MAASAELQERAQDLVKWNDRLSASVDRMVGSLQRQGEPLHRQVGGTALAFIHMGANMAISIPGMVSEIRFSRTAKKELGVRRAVGGVAAAQALLARDTEAFNRRVLPDGEILGVDDLAKRIAVSSSAE